MQKLWLQRPLPVNRIYYSLCLISSALLLACCLLWRTTAVASAQSCSPYPSPQQRLGFNVALDGGVAIDDYDAAQLGAGWYHDYRFQQAPSHPGGIRYHQMVRGAGYTTPAQIAQLLQQLGPVVDANPGQHWILGNEPDRHGQDGLTAAQYAVFYHDLYTFLKQRDPSSRIAIAGIVQPTPLRLRYLDLVLTEYQQRYGAKMPVEIWDIHNFIMPENCSWGAGIPPGLDAYRNEGIACPTTYRTHGDLTIFQQQIRTFRQWMNERGYRDRPLTISEYGILLSKYHGYDHPRVRDFMLGTFDFMLNTTDPAIGYPADDHRLIQEFAWFSLNYYEFDLNTLRGLNGNLFDHDSRQMTALGLDYKNYVAPLTVATLDLAIQSFQAVPQQTLPNVPVALHVTFNNQGGVAAQNGVVRFWNGDPRSGGQLLGAAPASPQIAADCAAFHTGSFQWTPNQLGNYSIFAELYADNLNLDSNLANNYANLLLAVSSTITATPTATVTPTETPTETPTPTATPTPALTLNITFAPSHPVAGENINYRVQYVNQSHRALANLGLRFTIPARVTLNRTQSASGWECTALTPNATCHFMIDHLASGETGETDIVLTLDRSLVSPADPVRLRINAQDAAETISVEASAETVVSGQQRFLYYLPYID